MWWFFYGLIVGAGVMRLVVWIQAGGIAVNWYVWAMGVLVVVLGALTAQNFFASHRELEPRAAWMGVLFMGVPCLILAAVVTWLLLPS